MSEMLSRREEEILKFIVGEYISTAAPVGSATVARKHPLGLSPATIRNEMAHLEEEGYITQPYSSAGRIPLEKGYRHYVEALMVDVELPQEEQCFIRDRLNQVSKELDQWLRLTTAILSYLVHNVAIVTYPKAKEPRLRHIELISLQKLLALLILVFKEAKLRQQMLVFDEVMSQQRLSAVAAKLNDALSGLTASEIAALSLELSPIEEQVVETVVRMMGAEEGQWGEELYVNGLRYFLGQPEFVTTDKALGIMEVFESQGLLRVALPSLPVAGGVQVFIGRENIRQAMHDCSVVVGCYGLPGEVTGVIGVVGPTRMNYERAIPAVRFLSTITSEMVSEVYR